jgi:hypothetical protein
MGNSVAGPLVTYLSPVVLMVVVRRHLAHPEEALMRKLLLLLLALPLLVLAAPSAQAQAATCTIDPRTAR